MNNQIDFEIAEKALKNNFSIICSNDFAGQYFLKKNQFSLMCTDCYKQNIFDIDESVDNKISTFHCNHIKEPGSYTDISKIVFETKEKKRFWCIDEIGFFDGMCQSMSDGFNNRTSKKLVKISPCTRAWFSSFENRIYVACEMKDKDTQTYGGVILAELKDGLPTKGTFCCGSAATLFLYLLNSCSKNNAFPEKSLKEETFNAYVNYMNDIVDKAVFSIKGKLTKENHKDINNALLSKFSTLQKNSFDKFSESEDETPLTYRFCPVCFRYHTSIEKRCKNCGFELQEWSFINKKEADIWKTEIVIPYRESTPHIDYRRLYRIFAQSKK